MFSRALSLTPSLSVLLSFAGFFLVCACVYVCMCVCVYSLWRATRTPRTRAMLTPWPLARAHRQRAREVPTMVYRDALPHIRNIMVQLPLELPCPPLPRRPAFQPVCTVRACAGRTCAHAVYVHARAVLVCICACVRVCVRVHARMHACMQACCASERHVRVLVSCGYARTCAVVRAMCAPCPLTHARTRTRMHSRACCRSSRLRACMRAGMLRAPNLRILFALVC